MQQEDNWLDSYNIMFHIALCLFVHISDKKLRPNIILVRYSGSKTVTQMQRALNLMETNCRTWEGNAERRTKAIRLYQANCRALGAREWENYENVKTQINGSNFPNSPGRRLLKSGNFLPHAPILLPYNQEEELRAKCLPLMQWQMFKARTHIY